MNTTPTKSPNAQPIQIENSRTPGASSRGLEFERITVTPPKRPRASGLTQKLNERGIYPGTPTYKTPTKPIPADSYKRVETKQAEKSKAGEPWWMELHNKAKLVESQADDEIKEAEAKNDDIKSQSSANSKNDPESDDDPESDEDNYFPFNLLNC